MMPNNLFSMMGQFGSFMQNPQQMLISRFNLPQNVVNSGNPQEITQYLLSNGKISQSQYNQANQMAQQIMNNPSFSNMFR